MTEKEAIKWLKLVLEEEQNIEEEQKVKTIYKKMCKTAIEALEKKMEIVSCKDCKHWKKDVPGCTDFVGRCEYANYMIGASGFCSYGERRKKNDW